MVPPYAWLRLLNEQRLLVVSVVLSLALATANCHENQGHPRLRRSLGSNFGKRITSSLVAELGKRPKEMFSFGIAEGDLRELGKRPKEMFSFGIGKRSISDDEMEEFLAEENHAKQAAAEENSHLNKRDPYAFGLGKRANGAEYSFGLGKKRDPYAFGLGKRADSDYAFGMGKKDDPYAFGLGKRADRYAFGLGKRDPYAFGLGKRDPYAFGLGKRDPYAFGLGKRDPYSFGLGRK